VWLTEEHVFIDDVPEAPLSDQESSRVKLVYCLHRLPHLSREEFQKYWREKHGPLVQKQKDNLKMALPSSGGIVLRNSRRRSLRRSTSGVRRRLPRMSNASLTGRALLSGWERSASSLMKFLDNQ